MEKISIGEGDVTAPDGNVERRGLTEPLGTVAVAINHYRLAPGGELPSGLHAHLDQEEVFVVLEGEAAFESLDGEVSVGAGEAVRFGPGEYQTGRNASVDRELVLFALGAPRDTEDVRIPAKCSACGHENLRLDAGEARVTLGCPNCGVEQVPAPCPDCGREDMRMALGETGDPVAVCRDCGAKFDSPPVRD